MSERGLITGARAIVFTRAEVTALADYAHLQPPSDTYHVNRDTAGVLWLVRPGGKLYRLSPDTR